MEILFYTNVPSPYRVTFFNELGKYCKLTVLFEMESSTERDKSWQQYKFDNFKGVILKGIRTRVDASFCPEIVNYLKKEKYDHIVITQIASFTAIWATLYMRLKHIPYCYEGDGGFVSSTKGIKACIKRFIIGNAQYCFSTSKKFDEYCLSYGAKENKIYRYSFSSVSEKDILKRPYNKEEKLMYKKEIGISEEVVLLAVGQFIHRKGFDLLLEMSRFLPKKVGVYIVGGKATTEYIEMKEKWDLQHVYFIDFMKKEELAQYYQAADIFVFPTREDIWGLVVNEAMAYALPVITTDRCVAGLELVKSGENGFIVKTEDVNDLLKKIGLFLHSESLLQVCAEGALKTIHNYTIEKMVECHMEVFKEEQRGV